MTNDESTSLGNAHGAAEPGAFAFAIDSLRELQATKAALAAMELTLLAAVHGQAEALTAELASPVTDRELALRTVSAEIGAALKLSDRSVQRRLSEAWEVSERFPAVLTALRCGAISAAHVAVIVRCGDAVTEPEHRETYAREALVRAEKMTAGRLGAVLPAVAEQITSRSITERHRAARKERGVWVRDEADGMSQLTALLPTVLAHGIFDRLTTMARSIAGSIDGDHRALSEVRADVMSDLCLGGGPVAVGDGLDAVMATVAVTIPVMTLAGINDGGSFVAGAGPIDADTARRLAGGAQGWDRVMTHPVTGAVLAVDRYRPNADIKRALRVRDEHCRFPGCRMPEHRGDRDHSEAAADGGETALSNMTLLCRRHHTLKHAANWAITHLGEGVLEWKSPSGRTYIDTPTPTLRFVPSAELQWSVEGPPEPTPEPTPEPPPEPPPESYPPPEW